MGIDFRRPRHIRGFRFGEVLIFDPGKALVEKTASGSIAHITDGADEVPVKSWLVTLPASLDGYTAVNAVKAGKNLLNPSLLSLFSSNKYVGTSNYNSEGTIDILGGENYVISFAHTITDGRVRYWDAEGNQISNVSLSNKQLLALTTPSNAVKMSFYAGQDTAQTSVADFEPMLEYGSTAHAYEPYTAPTTATANLGRTIYGGTADVVNGTGKEDYGYIVFDGSSNETWGGYSAYNGYYIDISDMKSGTRQDGVCNQLTCSKSTAQGQTNAFWLGAGNKRFYVIGVYDSMGNTLEAFKTYLSNNPLILVYPLATATDFTFTPLSPTPETTLGVNNFWADEGDSSVTYYTYAD